MNEPKEQQNRYGRDRHTVLWTAVVVMCVGCSMLVAAMAIPPPGVIDNSILVAFGEISTFSGALLGLGGKK